MLIAQLEAADLRRVLVRYRDRLRRHRDELNRLNVYPVPDGDTGTNMALTVDAVVAAADGLDGMSELAEAISHGSLMGAQGNSGIILSQVLRGFAEVMDEARTFGSAEFSAGMARASRAAYSAVGTPVEGTILTVLRQSAHATAEAFEMGEGLASMLQRSYLRAVDSLAETPALLPVLAEAGVVDAGGAGFLLFLASWLEEVSGETVDVPDGLFAAPERRTDLGVVEKATTEARFEVMFLLDAPADAGERLRDTWKPVGESIVVVGGAGEWSCHIHTNDIGAAVEAGVALGRPHRIVVNDLFEESAAAAFHDDPFVPLPAFAAAPVGVVSVAVGDGIASLFRDAGAQGLVRGGQTMNPSVAALLEVVEAVPANTVVVLPNNKNVVPAAHRLDDLTSKQVHVVATRTIPQGLAAMLAYQPGGSPEQVVAAMRAAAAGCRSGELTRAVRTAATPIGRIAEGDWLGLVDAEPRVVDADPVAAAVGLLGEIVADDTEVVTVITGRHAEAGVLEAVEDWLHRHHPHVEVERHHGGQPLSPYLFGAE